MKKLTAVILTLALVFCFAACGKKEEKSENLLEEIKTRGYITIATEGNWAPWTFHDENDVLTGFDVELGKLVAEGLGVEAQFEETPWDSILAGIDSGRFDTACNGVGYLPERAEKYYMSTPYVYMGTVLVVRGDNNDINSFEDLAGKTTANTASSTYALMAEKYGATVLPVDTLADTINLLLEGRIDGTVNAAGSIADYLTEHPDANIRIAATSNEEVEEDCIPVAKTDYAKPLMDEINKVLDELRANGKLAELSVKFFGADYTKK
jgi:cystine transport system substrate-binding protein